MKKISKLLALAKSAKLKKSAIAQEEAAESTKKYHESIDKKADYYKKNLVEKPENIEEKVRDRYKLNKAGPKVPNDKPVVKKPSSEWEEIKINPTEPPKEPEIVQPEMTLDYSKMTAPTQVSGWKKKLERDRHEKSKILVKSKEELQKNMYAGYPVAGQTSVDNLAMSEGSNNERLKSDIKNKAGLLKHVKTMANGVKVYVATHPSHRNLEAVHFDMPEKFKEDPKFWNSQVKGAIDETAEDGYDRMIIHNPKTVREKNQEFLNKSEKLAKDGPSEGYKKLVEAMKQKKTLSPGSTAEKIKAALDRQKDTNPYASPGPGGGGYSGGGGGGGAGGRLPLSRLSARELFRDRVAGKQDREEKYRREQGKQDIYRQAHGDEVSNLSDAFGGSYPNKRSDIPGRSAIVYSGSENDDHKFFAVNRHRFAVSKNDGKITHLPEAPYDDVFDDWSDNSSSPEDNYRDQLSLTRGVKSAADALKMHPEVTAITGKKYKYSDSPVHPGDYEKPFTGNLGSASVRSKNVGRSYHSYEYDKDSHTFRPTYTPSSEAERTLHEHVFEHVIRPKLNPPRNNAAYIPYSDGEPKGKIDTTKQADLPANVVPVKFGKSMLKIFDALRKSQKLQKKQGVPEGVDQKKQERCVLAVREQGKGYNPYAVCNSVLQKSVALIRKRWNPTLSD